MLRASILRESFFLAIVVVIAAMGSATTPAAASSSQFYGGLARHIPVHLHPVTSPGNTRYRPPSKKRA